VKVGAWARDDGIEFRVWAPAVEHVDVVLTGAGSDRHRLAAVDRGYHEGFVAGLGRDIRYRYAIGDALLPDPASRAQPDGVHGDSAIITSEWEWSDTEWVGRVITDYVVSEIHVGTFTDPGTFDAAIERLDDLREVGITAIELMPVAQFPGARNWGYDGVFPYAAQWSYGGADGLRRLVDACHTRGLAVILDVVYNHLGPEGNVLGAYGPYFTDRYRTPWGDALNFDARGSDEVRNYFVENALHWVSDFKIDALRLDAVHAIADPSAYPFIEELIDVVHECADREGRHIWVIAESAANDARLVTPKEHGGTGCDAQWNDDFHHALHALLTGERDGYYGDYGRLDDLAVAYREAFVYADRFSRFRGHRFGRSAVRLPGQRFVVFAQNHDQIGNRAVGDRLSSTVDADRLRLAAAATLCSPFVPLLFMGEEYGETAPFPYFVDHSDAALLDAVRKGRRAEFAHFAASGEPLDPGATETLAAARLVWKRRDETPHRMLLEWHARLLELRRDRPALRLLDPTTTRTQVFEDERVLVVLREAPGDAVALVLGFGTADVAVEVELPPGPWTVLLDSHAETRGTGDFANDDGTPVPIAVPAASVLLLGSELLA
jgi:maltooligosyltrehalose trehalohydrolase